MIRMYDQWRRDAVYQKGDRRIHKGKLWICTETHMSNPRCAPDQHTQKWAEISEEVPIADSNSVSI